MIIFVVFAVIVTASLERSQIQTNARSNEEYVRRQHEASRNWIRDRERY
jgi:hypothetical protein